MKFLEVLRREQKCGKTLKTQSQICILMECQLTSEYDLIMLCEFLQISIKIYSASAFTVISEIIQLSNPYIFGDEWHTSVTLWLDNLHYESIFNF
jgi:hypothetical protein